VVTVQELLGEELIEDTIEGPAILIISHTATIIALASAIPQGFIGDL